MVLLGVPSSLKPPEEMKISSGCPMLGSSDADYYVEDGLRLDSTFTLA